MTCDLCKKDSRISYSTRLYGEICNECMCSIKNSEAEKKERELEKRRMYKKYGRKLWQ